MGEPLPICFLNDEFLPLREARISPLDRGFLYSDGAYEVTPVYGGRPFRFAQHHARLTRSLKEIRMEDPLSPEAWRDLYRQLIFATPRTVADHLRPCRDPYVDSVRYCRSRRILFDRRLLCSPARRC